MPWAFTPPRWSMNPVTEIKGTTCLRNQRECATKTLHIERSQGVVLLTWQKTRALATLRRARGPERDNQTESRCPVVVTVQARSGLADRR
jgi:hypothetical protein